MYINNMRLIKTVSLSVYDTGIVRWGYFFFLVVLDCMSIFFASNSMAS